MGWRFFFYSNEAHEPIHIHCKKGEKDSKYWLDIQNFDVSEAFSYNINSIDKRQVKRLFLSTSNLLRLNGKNFKGGLKNEEAS